MNVTPGLDPSSFIKMPSESSADGSLPSSPDLQGGTVHLWSLDLNLPAPRVEALARLLTAEERQRAERFRFPKHRRRFLVRRARLRQLVAAYQGMPQPRLAFEYGPKGKPSLPRHLDDHPDGPLAFNLSDSEDLAVVALARGGPLGVDVEVLREMPEALSISKSFFAAPERDVLASVPETQRDQTFFNCWTRKEAYLKATGDGLSVALDRFTVTLHPDSECRFEAIDGDPEVAARWTLIAFAPREGAVGALASERRDLSIGACFRMDDR